MATLSGADRLTDARLTDARRLVVKIGSALLVDQASGELRRDWLAALVSDVAQARARGQDVAIVSSGSIALGRRRLAQPGRQRLQDQQAAAAVGQIRLAHAWQEALARHDLVCGQILVTFGDTENRRQYVNARATLETLFKRGAVPVINENDTVATVEIRYGDNDRLAARVAQMVAADCLILLSDVDGLYTADPACDPAAVFVDEVSAIDSRIRAMAGAARSDVGSGGMATKLQAAEIAVAAGCHMAIANGRVNNPLTAMAAGARCTWFPAAANPLAARKQWIAGSLSPAGALVIDAGAARALAGGRSLLPAGVSAVEGEFERGAAVRVRDIEGRALGRGISAYSATDARRIAGHKSDEIEALLGYRGRDEIIHRDDLAMSPVEEEEPQA